MKTIYDMRKRFFRGVGLLFLLVFVLYCLFILFPSKPQPILTTNDQMTSAWMVYWDQASGMQEWTNHSTTIDAISVFAVDYESDGAIHFPDGVKEMLVSVQSNKPSNTSLHLTIVNDLWMGTGYVQKDMNILYDILQHHTAAHIEAIVAMAKTYQVDVMELDFERIPEDLLLLYPNFIAMLSKELSQQGIELWVILEPKVVSGMVEFPDVARYVLMAYNVFGTHSGPGPKLNSSFFAQLMTHSNRFPGKVVIALATGGFDWSENRVVSVSELDARELQEIYDVVATRDEDSQAMEFAYLDEDGISHMVWYGDGITLSHWKKLLAETSDVAIWRLGGNAEESLVHLLDGRV